MPFAWTECQCCCSKRRSYFTRDEVNQLHRRPYYRYCRFCRVATLWSPVEPPQAPAEVPRPATAVRLEGPTVLVIDDDEDTLAVLRKVLTRKEYYVEAADSARAAISKMVNEDFDAIVSDVHMPDFDGKKLYLFIREYMPEYEHRVMFLTGDTESPTTREFLEQSGCPYTFKPINFDQLLGQINELISAGDDGSRH